MYSHEEKCQWHLSQLKNHYPLKFSLTLFITIKKKWLTMMEKRIYYCSSIEKYENFVGILTRLSLKELVVGGQHTRFNEPYNGHGSTVRFHGNEMLLFEYPISKRCCNNNINSNIVCIVILTKGHAFLRAIKRRRSIGSRITLVCTMRPSSLSEHIDQQCLTTAAIRHWPRSSFPKAWCCLKVSSFGWTKSYFASLS